MGPKLPFVRMIRATRIDGPRSVGGTGPGQRWPWHSAGPGSLRHQNGAAALLANLTPSFQADRRSAKGTAEIPLTAADNEFLLLQKSSSLKK